MLFNTGAYARAGVRMYRDPRQDVAQEMEGNCATADLMA